MKIRLQKLQQKGMVAIIVTMLIMFLLTIIVLAFAQLVRREQRQALDRQLTTQAFYTAESGVNAAIKAIQSGYSDDVTSCDPALIDGSSLPGKDFIGTTSRDISGDGVFKVTCILIDQSPEKLVYDSLSEYSGKIIPVRRQPLPGVNTNINIAWQDAGAIPSPNFSGCPTDFPPTRSNCNAPVLRIDLVEKGTSNVLTFFALPRSGGASATSVPATSFPTPENNGQIHLVNCNATMAERYCAMSIDLGVYPAGPPKEYALRILPTYQPAAITITGTTISLGGSLSFSGAQAMIDVTAQGNDVLRRVQAYVPVDGAIGHPEAAVFTTQDICKQLEVGPPPVTSTFGPAGCPSY